MDYIFWRKRIRKHGNDIQETTKLAAKTAKENPLSALQNLKFHAFPTDATPPKQPDVTKTPAAVDKSIISTTPVSTTGINLIDGKSTVGKSPLDHLKFHAFPTDDSSAQKKDDQHPFQSVISPIGLSSPAEKPLRDTADNNQISSPFGRLIATTIGASPAAGPRRLPPMHPPTSGKSDTAPATTTGGRQSKRPTRFTFRPPPEKVKETPSKVEETVQNRNKQFTFRPPPEIKVSSKSEENIQNRDRQPHVSNAHTRKGSIPFEISMMGLTADVHDENDPDRPKMPPLISAFSKKGSAAFERTNSAAGNIVHTFSLLSFSFVLL